MERFTISIEETLLAEFDKLSAARGYDTRSEAIRDLIRRDLEALAAMQEGPGWCVANLSYVYNHHERDLGERLMEQQHDHHDLCVSTMHAHLNHEDCLESVILRGPVRAVRQFAERVMAERGVKHGHLNMISMQSESGTHSHGHGHSHAHLAPRG